MSDDSEDDYMSDKLLGQCDEVRPGLIYNRAVKRKNVQEVKHQYANKISRTKSKSQLEDENRSEGLESAIDSNNKGFALLQKMGYKPGTSLGKREKGLTEPIPINVKNDRKGLGRESFVQRQIDEIRQRKKNKKLMLDANFQTEYRKQMKNKFMEKQIKSDIKKCQKSCEQLDQEMGVEKPSEPWFWISNVKNSDDEKDDEDSNDVSSDEELPEFEPSEKLEILTAYLRKIHKYCVWCGTSYEDDEDLQSNCPGNSFDEH